MPEKNMLDQTLDATLGSLLGILTPQKYRPAIKVSGKTGEIVVVEIQRGSSADQSGIRVGDVIVYIDGQPVAVEQPGKGTAPSTTPSPSAKDPANLEARALRLLEVRTHRCS